jgi:O-antigen/teichoic acid export membrane protein
MATSLTRNVIANGVGQGWRALMSFAFIPLYIKYLGIETYGLIGIFALLQAWLVLLDMGMRPALGREMARFTAGAHDARSIRDLLRSVELIGVTVACALALGIWAASKWAASNWLRAENLPVEEVARAFTAMGVVTALRFMEDIYVSCLAGLELQVHQNVIVGIMATARGLGAVGVLAWIAPTIQAFFLWQGLISLISVALFAGVVYHALPPYPRRARLSRATLSGIWHFAAGMLTITGLTLLLTQVDKVLLSRLLTLKAYGYYALAGVVASGPGLLVAPVTAAFYPRFTALTALGNEAASRAAYHQGAQLVTVLIGAAAAVLIIFRERVLLLWTGDPLLVQQAATVMAVLAFGTLLNGLMAMPYQMMLAHGWTALMIKASIVAVIILVPAILWIVPHYGAIGAAWIWVTLNTGFVTFVVPLMHRRVLRAEKWSWYRQDVAIPLAAATGVALLCSRLLTGHLSRIGEFSLLLMISTFVLLATALAAPAIRSQLIRYMASAFKTLIPGSAPDPDVESSHHCRSYR